MLVSILVSHRVLTPEKVVRFDHEHLCCYQSRNGGGCDPPEPERYRTTPRYGISLVGKMLVSKTCVGGSNPSSRAKAPQKGAFFIYFQKSG